MKVETFFDNFDMLADVPNGVQKLRELILQLAVRGKLVAQDEEDEPAAVLLEKIKAERELLIKDKKKKLNSMPPIEVNDISYDLPDGWKWVRLGDLGQTQTGTTPSKRNPDFFGKDYPFLKPGDISNNYVEYSNEGLSSIGIENGRLIKAGSILMVCIGGSIGKVNWVDRDCSCNQQINVLTPLLNLDSRFFTYFMRSRYFQDEVILTAPQTTLPILSKGKWELIPFPLPPLKEQRRIVAKVDQLMSLCDELEARQQMKRESHAHLNSAALDRLLAARAPEEFAVGWRRISDNFDLLYDAPENVGALRQAILQLAVMGKLVEQDKRDEPAEVLVERIKDENRIQIENQKNKKTPLFSSIKLTPFELPKNWKWCRMGEIAEIMMGNSPPGDSYNENGNGIPLINGPVEFSKDPFGYTNKTKFTTKPTKLCEENDLLICVRGSTTGRTNIAGFPACIGRGVAAIRARIHQEYVNYLVLSMRQQIYDLGTGSTFPSVSYGQLMELPIPLPPLAEQRRIVARVDQLMSLCDKLEAGLLRSQADSERLMEAVVGRMLAG